MGSKSGNTGARARSTSLDAGSLGARGKSQAWKFRTWLGTDGSVAGCNSTVRFGAGGPTVSVGGVNSTAVSGGAVETLCPDTLPFGRDTVGCPPSTNWMVADRRNGTGSYPVACFRQ